MVSARQSKTAFHAVLGAVLQVRDRRLEVLLWQRARDPYAGAWALPGGTLERDESLEQSIRRHLAAKVDVRELSHLEQLETRGDPGRNPLRWELATAYLGLVPEQPRPGRSAGHELAPGRQPAAARLRPPADRPRRPRAPARQALVHQHRLRARPRDVHDLRAARPLPGGARPRRLGHQPAPHPPAPRAAADHRRPARPGPRRAAGRQRSSSSARTRSRSPTSSPCFARRPPAGDDRQPGVSAYVSSVSR